MGIRDRFERAHHNDDFFIGAYSNAVGSFIGGLGLLIVVGLLALLRKVGSTAQLVVAGGLVITFVAGPFMGRAIFMLDDDGDPKDKSTIRKFKLWFGIGLVGAVIGSLLIGAALLSEVIAAAS